MENEKKSRNGDTAKRTKLQPNLSTKHLEVPKKKPIRKELTSIQKETELHGVPKDMKINQIESSSLAKTVIVQPLNQTSSTTTQHNSQQPATNKGNVIFCRQNPSYSYIDRYNTYKTRVLSAYQNRRIFTIHGQYPAIKSALLRRGWMEKIPLPNTKFKELQQLPLTTLIQNSKNGNNSEVVLLSKLLDNFPSYFIWQPKNVYDYYKFAVPYRNRIRLRPELDYTTKDGLLVCIRKALEKGTLGAKNIIHPRTYRLEYSNELADFERNYKLTCCLNLLEFISEKSVDSICSSTGEVDMTCAEFALKYIESEIFTIEQQHSNTSNLQSAQGWNIFCKNNDKIMNKDMKFHWTGSGENELFQNMKTVLAKARKFWPITKMDGYSNVWILKPSNCCRGSGIALMKDYNEIVAHAKKNPKRRYVVQKYIERPLLIYRTKFDIRQYVLVTIGYTTITIYLYKDMYVKFSSQEFDLKQLHESVHITNFAVQRKYKNGNRSDELPLHNMWSLHEFQNYLKSIDQENIWDDFIFPRIKDMVVSTLMSSLERANLVKNSFELYGVDLMITKTFQPVLIEINATPDMSPSTCVTALLCPAVLNDLVKVVIDLPLNSGTGTGNFMSVYKVNYRGVGSRKVESRNKRVNVIKSSAKLHETGVKKSLELK